jgi:hypothetical protein
MDNTQQSYTNKQLLVRGIKRLGLALPLLFLSPYLITLGFLNKDNWTLYLFLIPGIIAGILAILLVFKGLKLMLRAMFEESKESR